MSKRVLQYYTAKGNNSEVLDKDVTCHLQQGYYIYKGAYGLNDYLYQPMIRYDNDFTEEDYDQLRDFINLPKKIQK